jgi:hypothetical protein
MSAAFFDECFSMTGEVHFKDVELIATLLEKSKLTVPKNQLQERLDTLDHSDNHVMSGSDMASLFTTFSSVETSVDVVPPKGNTVGDSPLDTNVSCAMDLAEFEAAMKDTTCDNMPSLPQAAIQLALDAFNDLLLKRVQDLGVELEQEDILQMRADVITRDLVDIVKKTAEAWVDTCIYVTHTGGCKQLVLDLALSSATDEKVFRTAWSGMSEKKQQDAALVLKQQFETHIATIGVVMDPSDLDVLRAEWSSEHFLQILQATKDTGDGTCHNFPFDTSVWPKKRAEAFNQIWRDWSDAQKEEAVAMMQASFQNYTIEEELTADEASRDSSVWDSWGIQGFNDAKIAVLAKVAAAAFNFEPELPIDIIQDEEKKKKASALKPGVTEDQEKLIKVEMLRLKSALRQQFNNALGAAKVTKYENQLVEKEYWNVVIQVVEGTMVVASIQSEDTQETKSDRPGFSTPPRHGGASPAGAFPSPSGALCQAIVPVPVPVPVQVAATAVSAQQTQQALSTARLVKQNLSPRQPQAGAPLEFGSARTALLGELNGVRWIYECFLANMDVEYREVGDNKKEVATIVTCDDTGPLLVSVWFPDTDVLKKILAEYKPEDGQLMLRFEQLRFSSLPTSQWNGTMMTSIRVGHTITNGEKQSPMKKQRLDAASAPLSLRDGTRLTVIREISSPYMGGTSVLVQPQPPLVVTSYTSAFQGVQAPFRVTIAGTIHDLQAAEPTGTGELRRNFKLADDHGTWVPCVAHGRHAESEFLGNMQRIVVYFVTGRPVLNQSPQALWLFKDAFIVPIERRVVSLLKEQLIWQ